MTTQEDLDQSKSRGYVIVRERLRVRPAVAQFYDWCERRNLPYVHVVPARKYARVTLDMISTDSIISPEGRKAMIALLREREYLDIFIAGKEILEVSKVPIGQTHDWAIQLSRIASQYRIPRRSVLKEVAGA